MPLASYNPGNPAGMDPWSIESTLAPLAASGNPDAAGMLSNYQNQRMAANNVYGQNLAQEHQFAYKQLAQQMQEAQMKAISENADKGTLGLVMSAYPGIAGQASPDVINSTLGQLATNQGAKNLQATGAGFRDLSEGGALLNPNMLPGVPQNSVLQLTDNSRVRVEAMKNAAEAAKAAAPQGLKISGTGVPDPRTGLVPNFSAPKGWTWQQTLDAADKQGITRPRTEPPPPGAEPGTPDAQPGGRTNLQPMAKTDTPANAPGSKTTTSTQGQISPRDYQQVHQEIQNTPVTPANKQKMDDIKAGYLNGRPNIGFVNGKAKIIGKSGNTYDG